jgi:hypothetical protein
MNTKPVIEQLRLPDDVAAEVKIMRRKNLLDPNFKTSKEFITWAAGAAKYMLKPEYSDHVTEIVTTNKI